VHAREAESAEYLPAAQLVHPVAPVAAEYEPASQTIQADDDVSPVVARYLPDAQEVHEEEAESTAYFPAAQLAHSVAPEDENVPAAHDVQEVDDA